MVTNCEGQTLAEIPYLQAGKYNALSFLRIIARLTFGSQEVIGFDRTFQHLPVNVDDVVGPPKQIGVYAGGKLYAVKSLVHAVCGVVGQSTCVWSGFDITDPKQELCIIKDGWIQKSRANAEKDHLAMLKDIKGILKVLWGGMVQITDASGSSRDDSTLWIHMGFTNGLQS